MDTMESQLPVPLGATTIDKAKQAAIRDILRVRPIYTLQGPPGTGKTTLVSHLVRQILADDPVAQLLITAQAHGAVDVLRQKVRDEAFAGVEVDDQPLAVRLRPVRDGAILEEGSVESVSSEILRRARERLLNERAPTPVQIEWLGVVQEMLGALEAGTARQEAPDFCEVVKRGANLTYCTTSAGDLEALARSAQSFDWSILEEAGKAHGFDLALPLQAGHRWLLIGDQRQLAPHRIEDFQKGLANLQRVADDLWSLGSRKGTAALVDRDWVRSWRDRPEASRIDFLKFCQDWLKTFERIFKSCESARDGRQVTIEESIGAAAGMLSRQHRMHPSIGTLISDAYYDGQIVNETIANGVLNPKVVHPFTQPAGIAGRAIVWLDLPWAKKDARSSEVGPEQNQPRYTNPAEIAAITWFMSFLKAGVGSASADGIPLKLAVLSPYSQQVRMINRQQALIPMPPGIVRKENLATARRAGGTVETRLAHTVDSFQGNQADIVIVSLVRNSSMLPLSQARGFLDDPARINVLLSRAERLLVLVGSWDFFQYQFAHVRLEERRDPLWHWSRVLQSLTDAFGSGTALQIPVPETVFRSL